eukprot:CAMPEP_0176029020 /NCGR_PEP_ID=MMETSP0120_2-20121206/14253_1 /TAXON_ID=160619 /ORGANISM="Kryptoperidinium foliaceum, Strain CCMP 1326" /LENGTH=104 /DNA_ID=CAMNT_0017362239 /DNA_START=135 /DNA_END=446 /DNA_ORIENTATION=-
MSNSDHSWYFVGLRSSKKSLKFQMNDPTTHKVVLNIDSWFSKCVCAKLSWAQPPKPVAKLYSPTITGTPNDHIGCNKCASLQQVLQRSCSGVQGAMLSPNPWYT